MQHAKALCLVVLPPKMSHRHSTAPLCSGLPGSGGGVAGDDKRPDRRCRGGTPPSRVAQRVRRASPGSLASAWLHTRVIDAPEIPGVADDADDARRIGLGHQAAEGAESRRPRRPCTSPSARWPGTDPPISVGPAVRIGRPRGSRSPLSCRCRGMIAGGPAPLVAPSLMPGHAAGGEVVPQPGQHGRVGAGALGETGANSRRYS